VPPEAGERNGYNGSNSYYGYTVEGHDPTNTNGF
jgi:hypothetical protein